MILMTLDRSRPVDIARVEAVRQYRAGAARLASLADQLQAACDERPCPQARERLALAAVAADAAWLEEHDPRPSGLAEAGAR